MASGSSRDHPELTAALDDMCEDDTLVVWKLGRLAQSLEQLIETIEWMENSCIGFCSVTEAIDTTTAGGGLVFQIFDALAECQCQIIRERTCVGAARSRNRRPGRTPALTAKDILVTKGLLADHKINVEEVARRLGVSQATLHRHIQAAGSTVLEDAA